MPKSTITSADGTVLAARRSGHGSPMVLVHGAMGDLNAFALIEGLLAERHSVWVYSRRGRGGSGDGPDYSIEREVEDVLAVLAAAGDHAHLVGHSGGATYCLLAAMQRPSLRSLVLYEPPLRDDRFDPNVLDAMQRAVDAGDPDRAMELFFSEAGIVEEEAQLLRSLPPVVRASMREAVCLVPREVRSGQEANGQLTAFDPPDIPTLYLYGELTESHNFLTPDEVAELLPNAQLRTLAGQRHLAPSFDPSSFAQAVLAFTTAYDK